MYLERATYRYVFVFDITQSMNVMDVSADGSALTRLDYAKQSAAKSLSTLPCGAEVGLALFSGHRAFLLITPIEICANYGELLIMLDSIDWRMTWEARSEVAKGLYKSVQLLQQLPGQSRLIFFSDGHEAPPINPELPPQFVGTKGEVKGLIVGVGGKTPVPIPKFDKTGEQQGYWKAHEVLHIDAYSQARSAREGEKAVVTGTEHLSSLREAYLKVLADNTGLTYLRLGDAKQFAKQLQSKTLRIPKIVSTDMRWLFALGSLIAILATLVIAKRNRSEMVSSPEASP